jgi:hypothetical protein
MKKEKIIISISVLIALILLLNFSESFSLTEGTHKEINKEIAKGTINGFSLDVYLKKYFRYDCWV